MRNGKAGMVVSMARIGFDLFNAGGRGRGGVTYYMPLILLCLLFNAYSLINVHWVIVEGARAPQRPPAIRMMRDRDESDPRCRCRLERFALFGLVPGTQNSPAIVCRGLFGRCSSLFLRRRLGGW